MSFDSSASVDNGAFVRRIGTYLYLAALLVLSLSSTFNMETQPVALAVIATVVALMATGIFAAAISRLFNEVARRPIFAMALVGLVSLILNALSGHFVQIPIPAIRDEFSFLLNADTFASGRLSNETHPFWPHFDSEHIIQTPSYQSKYPPGQGLFLALGQILFGHPVVGVWISLALACAATTWMLQAWLPAKWSLLGGLLLVSNFELFQLWGQSYWGGAVAMLGGALLFGGLRRVVSAPNALAGAALSIGVLILAASRPYEGLLASIPAAILLCVAVWRPRAPSRWRWIRPALVPGIVIIVLGASALAYYNYRVTGSAFVMPYQVWLQSKGTSINESLLQVSRSDIQKLKKPLTGVLSGEENGRVDAEWERQLDIRRPAAKIQRQFRFYVGLAFLLPIAMLPMILRRRWMQFATLTWMLVLAGVMLNGAAGFAHYSAPIVGLVMVVSMQGLRYLRQWRCRGRRPGKILAVAIPVFAVAIFAATFATEWIRRPVSPHHAWAHARATIQESLESVGGKHLILVRYQPDHLWYREWVYNGANIDSSAVVWAKELSNEENGRLIEYFDDRRIWLVQADKNGDRLSGYKPISTAD